jgi:hypothetical protein
MYVKHALTCATYVEVFKVSVISKQTKCLKGTHDFLLCCKCLLFTTHSFEQLGIIESALRLA